MSLDERKLNLISLITEMDNDDIELLEKVANKIAKEDYLITEEIDKIIEYKKCWCCYESGRNTGCVYC